MKKFLWILIVFFILPTVASVILLKLTIGSLTNFLLGKYINAPFKIQKVDANWIFTKIWIENFKIFQPPNFGKGVMLNIQKVDLNLDPSTYWKFQPYGTLKVKDFYLHYKEVNGISNIAVAFNIPVNATNEKTNQEFELKQVNLNSTFKSLKDINYTINGFFVGFHNNAQFQINGTGDISQKNNPKILANFVIYNWILKNKNLKLLIGKNEIKLTKIIGTIKIEGEWIYFVNKNTKAYTIDNILFAEIYKNSKYNRLTKELYITGVIFYPIKVDFKITGTINNPKITITNIVIPKKLNSQNLLPNKNIEKSIKNIQEEIKNKIANPIEGIKNQLKKTLNETEQKLKNNLNSTLNQIKQNIKQLWNF